MSEPEVPETLPLFPLSTVLFPGGTLPLQIFETRYTDMVSRCMREGSPFGVVLLLEGREARRDSEEPLPRFAAIGTRAHIVDFTQLPNGLLGITAQGGSRFRILAASPQDDHLLIGRVETLPDLPAQAVPEEYASLVDILQQLLAHPEVNRLDLHVDLGDARSVAGRLTDLLPLSPPLKQALLELEDPELQLAELERAVHALQAESDRAD